MQKIYQECDRLVLEHAEYLLRMRKNYPGAQIHLTQVRLHMWIWADTFYTCLNSPFHDARLFFSFVELSCFICNILHHTLQVSLVTYEYNSHIDRNYLYIHLQKKCFGGYSGVSLSIHLSVCLAVCEQNIGNFVLSTAPTIMLLLY